MIYRKLICNKIVGALSLHLADRSGTLNSRNQPALAVRNDNAHTRWALIEQP